MKTSLKNRILLRVHSFREWMPLPMWASDPTVNPETKGHTRIMTLVKVRNKHLTYITGFW